MCKNAGLDIILYQTLYKIQRLLYSSLWILPVFPINAGGSLCLTDINSKLQCVCVFCVSSESWSIMNLHQTHLSPSADPENGVEPIGYTARSKHKCTHTGTWLNRTLKTTLNIFLNSKLLFFFKTHLSNFFVEQELQEGSRGYQHSYNLLPQHFNAVSGVSPNTY